MSLVKRDEISLREYPSSLLPRAWSRALIPFPFPFERLPRRLSGLSRTGLKTMLPRSQETEVQRIVLLGTAHILRRSLSSK